MNCPKCGGTMSPNPRKLPTNKQPDFLCNQDNGACGSTTTKDGKTYNNVTGAWKPKEGGFQQYAQRPTPGTPMVANPTGDGFIPAPKPTDYEKKEQEKVEGMVRHGVICAMITAGYDREKILMEYQDWCDLIINGTPL